MHAYVIDRETDVTPILIQLVFTYYLYLVQSQHEWSFAVMNRGTTLKHEQHNPTNTNMIRNNADCDFQQYEPTLYTVKGMAILDNDGNRILAKYYDKNIFPTSKEQKAFEKNLFNKTHRANAEIIMLDGLTCVYRSNVDLFFYVMGSSHENELILMSVLNCLYDSVSQILRKNVEKRAVLDSLDIVMLAMDEICDGGIILDADASSVVQRVALRTDDIPLGEQTVAQVLQSAKEQLKWSLLK